MYISGSEVFIFSIGFVETEKFGRKQLQTAAKPFALVKEAEAQLRSYFEGSLRQFRLPLQPEGTAFQHRVWAELKNIEYGKSLTYMDIAMKLGDAKSIRAAASANGKNNLAIVVPCHRVVGSNGTLVGYAGDLWRKQWLLEHESRIAGTQNQLRLF